MKKVFEFDDIVAVETAIGNLRRYNQAMYMSLDDARIDTGIAEKYFRAADGSEEKLKLRKMVRAAVIMACNDNPDIPDKYKRKVGDRMSREYVSAMDAAAIDFGYFSGEYGMPGSVKAEEERERRHKEIALVRKTHFIDKVTKKIRSRGIRIVEKSSIEKIIQVVADEEPTIRWATRGIMLASDLIPKEVRQKIRTMAAKACEKASNIIHYRIERFERTPFGSKVMNVMRNKVEPVLEKGFDKVSAACSKIKSTAKSISIGIKSIFA